MPGFLDFPFTVHLLTFVFNSTACKLWSLFTIQIQKYFVNADRYSSPHSSMSKTKIIS